MVPDRANKNRIIYRMKFVFRKNKNIAEKYKVHTDTIVREESRIENLKVIGIMRKNNGYCLVQGWKSIAARHRGPVIFKGIPVAEVGFRNL